MYIDVAAHIMTQNFTAKYRKMVPSIENRVEMTTPSVTDLEIRMRLMSRNPDVLQVLTMANLPLERYVDNKKDAIELAKAGNDDLAELVQKYPDKFLGAAAILPMNDVDAAMKEAERAIKELGLQGIQLYTRINGESLGSEKFRPIFKMMEEFNLPIWIHPTDNPAMDADRGLFTWEYELTYAMLSIVRAGIFIDYPEVKILVHHAGAMIPFYANRVRYCMNLVEPLPGRNMHEHFKKFYVDTAIFGHTPGLMNSYDYYGAEKMLYGTDAPLGPKWGLIRGTIESIERMDIPEEEKVMIYRTNALELFGLVL